jgi:hypothetical protein
MQGPAEKVLLARQGLNTACSLRYIVSILGQRRNSKKPKITHYTKYKPESEQS